MRESLGPPPEPSAIANGRITQLDGLRAVAVLMILVHHNLHVPLMWVGVDIFFVLSGFLITGILLARKASGTGYFSYFYRRRAFRILPPYIVTLLACGILITWHNFFPWPAFAFFGMNMNNLFWHAGDLPVPLWSLAVEEQFYLVWPIVILLISEAMLLRVAVAAVFLVPILRVLATPLFPTHYYIYYLTPFRADLLCAGAALALLWKDRTPGFELFCRRRAWIGLLIGFGGMAFVQVWHVFRLLNNTRAANGLIYSLSLVGSVSLVSWSLADRGWLTRGLNWRPLRFIGRISYTMYLVGALVEVLALRFFHSRMVVLAIDIAGTIAWATMSWYVMERPILDFASGKTKAAQVEAERYAAQAR
ncbi:MAG TPA: acyltransferase [Acidisarcina sp.]